MKVLAAVNPMTGVSLIPDELLSPQALVRTGALVKTTKPLTDNGSPVLGHNSLSSGRHFGLHLCRRER